VHVRVGGSSNELRSDIITNLVKTEGYTELDKELLFNTQIQRKTDLGRELARIAKHKTSGELINQLLRKIVYSGNKREQKYVLTNYPGSTDEALDFERGCAHFSAVIYACQEDPIIEVGSANLNLFNIDGMYHK